MLKYVRHVQTLQLANRVLMVIILKIIFVLNALYNMVIAKFGKKIIAVEGLKNKIIQIKSFVD